MTTKTVTPQKLRVKNHKDYALFNYEQYHDRNVNVIARPAKLTYDLGDVVYIIEENSIGVVIGCVSEETQDVRTDMDGMQSYEQIRPATPADFKIDDVRFTSQLFNELFNHKKKEVMARRYLSNTEIKNRLNKLVDIIKKESRALKLEPGEKPWRCYRLNITELVWGRNNQDGYLVEVCYQWKQIGIINVDNNLNQVTIQQINTDKLK